MPNKPENRKNWWLGVSPGSWLQAAALVVTAVYLTATYAGTIVDNKKKLDAMPKQMTELKNDMIAEIKKSDEKQTQRMDRMEGRLGTAIRDLRNAVMRGNASRRSPYREPGKNATRQPWR